MANAQLRWGKRATAWWKKSGQRVLQADALGQASARYLERTIDLNATPYLHWCWQVSTTYPGLDETTKAGDDYPRKSIRCPKNRPIALASGIRELRLGV